MADTGNIFDNSGSFPAIGQEPSPAAGNEPTNNSTPPTEGQGVQSAPAEGTQAQPTEPTPNAAGWQSEFKTPEELYEAYSKTKTSYENLRPAFTKATTELSQLRKQAQTPADNQPNTDPNGNVNPLNVLLNKVQESVNPLREQVEEMKINSQVAQLAANNPNFKDIAPVMKAVFEEKPWLWNTANPIDSAFEIAEARFLKQNLGRMVQDTRQQAYAEKELRVLDVNNRTTPAQQPTQKSDADLIKESILGEQTDRGIF